MKEKRLLPISVVIPTLNRKKILASTIDSLISGSCVPDEIIVVDQSEETLDPHLHSDWCDIVKVYKEEILSSSRARNIGVRNSSNDIILFSDDDIEIDKDTIRKLYEEMSREDIALISAINCKENAVYEYKESRDKILRNWGGYLIGTRTPGGKGGYIIKWSMKGHYEEGMTRPHHTEWAYGFFFCVRKSLMKRWNVWFDENLIKYAFAEDMDFSCRYCRCANKENLMTLVEPRVYVHHLISKEWRMPSDEAILFGFINRWYLSYKLFPKEWWYRIGMIWSDFWYTLLVFRGEQKLIGYKAMKKTYSQRRNLRKGIIVR